LQGIWATPCLWWLITVVRYAHHSSHLHLFRSESSVNQYSVTVECILSSAQLSSLVYTYWRFCRIPHRHYFPNYCSCNHVLITYSLEFVLFDWCHNL
jgi:hypothetical protein